MTGVLRDSDLDHRSAAIIDALTGMLNRAALSVRTAELEHQSVLTGDPVGVIVADLDHFKAVNDTHGHQVGDAVLRDLAYVLRRELRSYELVYRLGGEEFVILVAGADRPATSELAERLRAAVATAPIAGVAVTMSLGVAASDPGTPFVWQEVYTCADGRLYQAKHAGRNRVGSGLQPVAA